MTNYIIRAFSSLLMYYLHIEEDNVMNLMEDLMINVKKDKFILLAMILTLGAAPVMAGDQLGGMGEEEEEYFAPHEGVLSKIKGVINPSEQQQLDKLAGKASPQLRRKLASSGSQEDLQIAAASVLAASKNKEESKEGVAALKHLANDGSKKAALILLEGGKTSHAQVVVDEMGKPHEETWLRASKALFNSKSTINNAYNILCHDMEEWYNGRNFRANSLAEQENLKREEENYRAIIDYMQNSKDKEVQEIGRDLRNSEWGIKLYGFKGKVAKGVKELGTDLKKLGTDLKKKIDALHNPAATAVPVK